MKYADLHVHTIFSDGTFTPEEVVRYANQKELSCIAICDHDCVDGIDPSLQCSKKIPVEIIPGVELTVIEDGKEVHVLGYYISWKERWFGELLGRVQKERVVRIERMIEKLKDFNVKLDKEMVMNMDGGKGSVGRLHLARALVKIKAVSSIQAVFDKYIGDSKPCYVEDIGFSAKEAVDIILKVKGVPVLAHPGTIKDDSLVQEFIKFGVRGIEAFHPDHPLSASEKYKKMAEEHGLLVTGGSDCHGFAKKKVLIGGVKVPYTTVEKLKEERDRIKR